MDDARLPRFLLGLEGRNSSTSTRTEGNITFPVSGWTTTLLLTLVDDQKCCKYRYSAKQSVAFNVRSRRVVYLYVYSSTLNEMLPGWRVYQFYVLKTLYWRIPGLLL